MSHTQPAIRVGYMILALALARSAAASVRADEIRTAATGATLNKFGFKIPQKNAPHAENP